ncbi:methyltransferase [Porticoccus sp.]|uniref:methyltransferase n=1 Tax=Porticoccus sp. TaxID=2024853 RepID=UPI003F6997CC
MTDPAFQLLLDPLRQAVGRQLLVTDENLHDAPLDGLQNRNILLITNRYDLFESSRAQGIDSEFSDFDFNHLADGSFNQVLYRVSKEKPIVHHVINQARRLLPPGGPLIMAGAKSDGIKTYAEKAGHYFGDRARPEKLTTTYRVRIRHLTSTEPALDDQQYGLLRPCVPWRDKRLFSKPGQFGWNKVDQGSAYLATHLKNFFRRFDPLPTSILDLGCGYGYLSAMAAELIDAEITATDNNAAAVASCQRNFMEQRIKGTVVASNCGDSLTQYFDAVICNPPFHQGFSTDHALTRRFVSSCHRLLRSGGHALFVVNRFVPLERFAETDFDVQKLDENRSFKLVLLTKSTPRRQ